MQYVTLGAMLLATPITNVRVSARLLGKLSPLIGRIIRLVAQFGAEPATPEGTYQFELQLARSLREIGRQIVQCRYNHLESEMPELLPMRIEFLGDLYRRKERTPNRNVATLFGKITLWRFQYQPVEIVGGCIFPIELALGLQAGVATPALADRVAWLAADTEQRPLLEILRRDHGVAWSVATLRKLTESISRSMTEHGHKAAVDQLREWLTRAREAKGNRKVILSVGRDGVFVPIRGADEYKEASAATVSVLDRRGRRLGTIYLGRMPESGQGSLSDQLTRLLQGALSDRTGPMPRLVYVTDAGHHQTDYFGSVLSAMSDPSRPGERLRWEWTVDYYHATSYISKLAEVIFGRGREAQSWSAKMRRVLRDKPNGVVRVLHSAAALRHKRGGLVGASKDYHSAYNYLRSRIGHMNYAVARRTGAPIGSGVTEAACKTLFNQRMKRSGMKWNIESGQWIVDLRALRLSGIWDHVRTAHLKSQRQPLTRTQTIQTDDSLRKTV